MAAKRGNARAAIILVEVTMTRGKLFAGFGRASLGAILAGVLAILVATAAPAFAGHHGHKAGHHRHASSAGHAVRHVERQTFVRERQGGRERVCVPMCADDTLPCDPIYFKLADGRCAWDR